MKEIVPTRIYSKLFTASYLSRKRVRIVNFTNFVDFLAWEEMEQGGPIIVNSLDYDLLWNFKDLIEKIGFIILSFDILKVNLKKDNALMKLPFKERIIKAKEKYKDDKYRNDKYYFYNFIIYLKASLDSIAVILNSFYGWGFKNGDIDLGKNPFLTKLSSLTSFNDFQKKYLKWIRKVIMYRDAIIHQKSVDIFRHARSKLIPLFPLTVNELDDILENYKRLVMQSHKQKIPKRLQLINMNSFMKTCIKNILEITGLLSTEILNELKKRYPSHKPSTRTFY